MEKVKGTFRLAVPLTLFIAIIACFGDDAVNTSINPAFASISAAFPDIPYSSITWLYTFPKLLIIPFALLSGAVAGKKVSFKFLAVFGMGIIGFVGIAPAFLNDSFLEILILRMLLGVGLGIQAPLGPALVMRLIDGDSQRAYALGIGNGFINVYGVITNMLVGVLCAIDWKYCFLAYGTIIILFVIVAAFLKEPPKLEEVKRIINETDANKALEASADDVVRLVKEKMPTYAVVLCIIFGLVDLFWMPASINASAIVAQNGFGDAALTGILISLINIAGMIAGFTFGFVFKFVKRYDIPMGFFIMAVGLCFVYFATSTMMIAIGLFVGGFAFSLLIAAIQNELSIVCPKSQMAMAASLFMVFENIGGFCASWYVALVMDVLGFSSYVAPVGFSIILFFVGGICFTVFVRKTKGKFSEELAEYRL